MVLIRRNKRVELVKPPVPVEGQDPDVFFLAATAEIFLDYESYTARLSFYNQPIFQCELTGKSGLTFFDALLSESQELARIVRDFPEALKRPVLNSANFAVVGRLDQLVDLIYERFYNRFWPGDIVQIEIDNDKYHAEIKEVYPPGAVWRHHQEKQVDVKLREYESRRSVSLSPAKSKHRSPMKAAMIGTSSSGGAKADDSDSDLSELTELPPASQEMRNTFADAAARSLKASEVAHKIGTDLSIPLDRALKLDPPDGYLYRLQLLDGSDPVEVNSDSAIKEFFQGEGAAIKSRTPTARYNASVYESYAGALSRDRLKFSKVNLKKLLREAMQREAHVGAPWTVNEKWATAYKIDMVPSEAVAKKNEEIREAKLLRRKKVVEEPEQVQKKKKVSQAELRRQAAEEARLQKEKEDEEKRLKAEKRKNLKYPAEDLELDPINARELSAHVPGEVPRVKQRPPCKRELPGGIDGSLLEILLSVYGYLQAVGKPLQLSPFTLDDFEAALRHSTHEPQCALVVEVHAALLNAIIRDGNFSKELAPAALSVVAPQTAAAATAAPVVGSGEAHQRLTSLKREEGGASADATSSRAGSVNGRTSREGSAAAAAASTSSFTAGRGRGSLKGKGRLRELEPESEAKSESDSESDLDELDDDQDDDAAEAEVAVSLAPARSSRLRNASAKVERASAAELALLNGADSDRRVSGRRSGASRADGRLEQNGDESHTNGGVGDTSFGSLGGVGGSDFLDITPEELVLSNALHAGRGWEKRILKLEDGRRGWELALIGCLAKRATMDSVPRLWGILSQLTGTDHPDGRVGPKSTFVAETYPDEEARYPILPFEDKVAALQFVCELSMMTKHVRAYFEECENTLTELRKERAEISRARKQVDEERRDLAVRELTRDDNPDGEDGATKEEADANGASSPSDTNGEAADVKMHARKADTPNSDDDVDMADEDDGSDDEYDDGGSTSNASDGQSAGARANKRQRLASRQETLRKQAIEREAAEAAKEAQRARQAQARKDKNAEARQIALEKKRLEEEHARVTKREEAWEREFRRFQFGPRLKPLGYDRFYQRYWWLDGLGTAPLVNAAGNIVYSTGRIFVQGPAEHEWEYLCAEVSEKEVRSRVAEELEGGEEQLLGGHDQWGVYDDPETVEVLFAWLRVRGIREDKFKKEFAKWRPYILGGMTRRNESLNSTTRPEAVEGRRSVRTKTEANRQSHMAWTNKAAIK